MKTVEELITELLFANDSTLLAHTEEALQHIFNHFSDATKNFGLTISLKKTEALYQPPPREACSTPHISIDGTNLNAVEYFTYLGSVISNDVTVSKNLDNRLSKAKFLWKTFEEGMAKSLALPLHKAPGIQGRHHSHLPVRCKDLGSLSEADQATGAVLPTLPALHPWHQMARPRVEQRSPQETHLPSIGSILLQVQQLWAGHVTRMEDVLMPKAVFFRELQEEKLDRGAPRKRYKDQLKRHAQAGIGHQ